jgi:hypothetical protein
MAPPVIIAGRKSIFDRRSGESKGPGQETTGPGRRSILRASLSVLSKWVAQVR